MKFQRLLGGTMVLDRQVLNKKFFILAFLIIMTNLIFFFLNVLTCEKLITEKFPDKYSMLLIENMNLKRSMEMNSEIQDIQRSIINEQQQYLEYYNVLFINKSLENVYRMEEQKEFFDEELEREIKNIKMKIEKEKKCQKNLLTTEQLKPNVGVGGS